MARNFFFLLRYLENTNIYKKYFTHKNCVTFLSNNTSNKYFCYDKYIARFDRYACGNALGALRKPVV
jgi:hypothetical protein